MKSQTVTLFALVIAAVGLAHDHYHEEQIPLNYVKYPYQAVYPGDDEGIQYNLSFNCCSPAM
jgi:agmatinase